MKDFHDLYLKCDVLLSADVFEKFKNAQLGCILGCKLGSKDVDMYLHFEKCMRSGVSYTSKRYRKAKNKYLSSYDFKNLRNVLLMSSKMHTVTLSQNLFQWVDLSSWFMQNLV